MFAVRTTRETPVKKHTGNTWPTSVPNDRGQLLPEGEGNYINPSQLVKYDYEENSHGKQIKNYYPSEYQDVEFPFALVKPQLLSNTKKAITAKIFDRIGSVSPTKKTGDPMIIGQIVKPGTGGGYMEPQVLSFFISWFLEIEDL